MAASTLVRAMVVGFDPPEAHIAGGFVVPERLWTPHWQYGRVCSLLLLDGLPSLIYSPVFSALAGFENTSTYHSRNEDGQHGQRR
jgi:hypothetical protein